jgi:hypothetical protein
VVDHLPVDPAPEAPLPRRATLTLLVGRVTTIKLAYWAAMTIIEIALPLVDGRSFAERFPLSVGSAVVTSVAAMFWARHAARAPDRRVGILTRSIPSVATTFAATTVVASPASLPLLIVERERSLEQCGFGTCHVEALWLWIAVLIVGTLVIPAVFAASLHRQGIAERNARSLDH